MRHRALIEAILRKMGAEGQLACTVASGVADARLLATGAIRGMWFFLGVEIDPRGLKPQPVRVLEVPSADKTWHVMLANEGQRVLATSSIGQEDLLERLAEMGVEVEWHEDGAHVQ
ncbi:MAG: hypothetical protein ACHQ50_09975 [Fimbriimonadales bacterium]